MITDLRRFEVLCHTKFRFAEREAQCILGECGPLMMAFVLFCKNILDTKIKSKNVNKIGFKNFLTTKSSRNNQISIPPNYIHAL